MTLLLDTNIIVATVTYDTERTEAAIELLNKTNETHVSVLSLMELRSVLTKKKQFERDRIDQIENRVTHHDHLSRCFGYDRSQSTPV